MHVVPFKEYVCNCYASNGIDMQCCHMADETSYIYIYFFNFYWCSSFKKCAFFLLAEGCPISHRAPTCLQPTNVFMWAAIWKSPSLVHVFFHHLQSGYLGFGKLDTLGPWDGQPPTPTGCWLMARCRCSDIPNSIGGDSSWDGGMHPNRYQHWQQINGSANSSNQLVRS